MRQIKKNDALKILDFPELTTVTGWLWVRARLRSADLARAATRIAQSLPCR